jgi:phosphatidylglycerophosphatase C
VEVMAGLKADALQALCDGFFHQRFVGRIFPWARLLLAQLAQAGYQPWIVSASPLWPVLSGARVLQVPANQVIGVDCELDEGELTTRVIEPVPCGPGKVTHLQQRGVRPVLAVGNGELDLDMLAFAERALVVAPLEEHNLLVAEAARRGWPIQRC